MHAMLLYWLAAFVQLSYRSRSCSPFTLRSQRVIPFSCLSVANGYTIEPTCTSNSTVDLASLYSNKPTCPSVLEFQAIRNDVCITPDGTNSIYYSYPNATLYSGVTNCSGTPTITSLPPLASCSVAPKGEDLLGLGFPYSSLALNSSVSSQ
eukprot:scaffold13700_cov252-Ochromonas_danica.AAC.4